MATNPFTHSARASGGLEKEKMTRNEWRLKKVQAGPQPAFPAPRSVITVRGGEFPRLFLPKYRHRGFVGWGNHYKVF